MPLKHDSMHWCDANDESGDCENWLVVSVDTDEVIAIVPKSEPCEDSDTGVAITDASKAITLGYCQLLAAAPDLLAVCEAIVELADFFSTVDCQVVHLARAAIAKANGQTS